MVKKIFFFFWGFTPIPVCGHPTLVRAATRGGAQHLVLYRNRLDGRLDEALLFFLQQLYVEFMEPRSSPESRFSRCGLKDGNTAPLHPSEAGGCVF